MQTVVNLRNVNNFWQLIWQPQWLIWQPQRQPLTIAWWIVLTTYLITSPVQSPLVGSMQANFYSQGNPSRWRKPIVQPLWLEHTPMAITCSACCRRFHIPREYSPQCSPSQWLSHSKMPQRTKQRWMIPSRVFICLDHFCSQSTPLHPDTQGTNSPRSHRRFAAELAWYRKMVPAGYWKQ
jgi:hypothetical protein